MIIIAPIVANIAALNAVTAASASLTASRASIHARAITTALNASGTKRGMSIPHERPDVSCGAAKAAPMFTPEVPKPIPHDYYNPTPWLGPLK